MLHLPDPSSGLNDPTVGSVPVDNTQLTAAFRNCRWLKRAASSKVMQPASNSWLMSGYEGLTPSSPLWKAIPAPELWLNFLSPCLECISDQLLPLPSSTSFPSHSVDPENAPQKNSLYANLYLRTLSGKPNQEAKEILKHCHTVSLWRNYDIRNITGL